MSALQLSSCVSLDRSSSCQTRTVTTSRLWWPAGPQDFLECSEMICTRVCAPSGDVCVIVWVFFFRFYIFTLVLLLEFIIQFIPNHKFHIKVSSY